MNKYYDFTIAAVISNHCVFQRNKNISIFGKAFKDDIVKAELFDRNDKLLAANETKVIATAKASSSSIKPKITIIQPPAEWLVQLNGDIVSPKDIPARINDIRGKLSAENAERLKLAEM